MPAATADLLAALVEQKHLTREQADALNSESLSSGESIDALLIRKRMVTEDDLVRARAKAMGIAFVTLAGKAIAPNAVNFIPEAVARRYTLVPFTFDEKKNELSVAMLDPLDFQVIEFLEKKSGKHVLPFMGVKDDIVSAIEDVYTQNLGEDVKYLKKNYTLTKLNILFNQNTRVFEFYVSVD